MKRRKASKTKKRASFLSSEKAGLMKGEIRQVDLINKRRSIKNNIKKALISKQINPDYIGKSGSYLSSLNLNKIGDRKKRRILGKLVAAAGRAK